MIRNFLKKLLNRHEEIKNVSSAFHNLFLIITICVGGFWAVYSFAKLNEAELAKVKVETKKTQNEIAKLNLEKTKIEMSLPPIIDVKLKIISIKRSIAFIDLIEKNNSEKSILIENSNRDFMSVKRIRIQENDLINAGKIIPPTSTSGLILRKNETKVIPSLFKFRDTGYYYIIATVVYCEYNDSTKNCSDDNMISETYLLINTENNYIIK